MAVYAYYRVSTKTQVEQNGIAMQVNVVEKYCKENGIELAGEFKDEGISGTRTDREGLQDLLSTLEEGDRVIVQNTSRLWRNDTVKVLIHHEMKKHKCDVISVEQANYSLYNIDPTDFLTNSILEILDQYERMTISMKLAKGRRARAEKGYKACGNTPLGYKWEGNEVVPDEAETEIVHSLFNEYLANPNLSALSRRCTERGILTRNGKEFSRQTLRHILSNPYYIGTVTYNGKAVLGNHKAIIDNETFESVQSVLS